VPKTSSLTIDTPQLHYAFRDVDHLIPDPRNSRTHSLEQIHELDMAIGAYGFTNPVLVDGDKILAGHGRREAVIARRDRGDATFLPNGVEIPYGMIPTIDCSGWTETQRRAYVIWDNKSVLLGDWNEEILASELRALSETTDFDMSLTGFNEAELDELLMPESSGGKTDPDAVPEKPAKPVTRAGDIWILGNHRVMCGDATDSGHLAQLMFGHGASMIFTDPPYGVDYDGIRNDDRAGLAALLDGAFGNMAAAARPGAPVYVFHSDRCADIFHQAFRKYFHFSSMIIWVKPALVLSRTDYQSRHEPCLYGWMEGAPHPWYSDRKQTSVWEFDKEPVPGHTTPKPVDLICRAIKHSSKPGHANIVLDLFGGSGSTLIACEKSNRGGALMELDPGYCDVIVRRWQEFTGGEAILQADSRTFDQVARKRVRTRKAA
jgi:DNA modification methylase